jgi:MFS family permease
MGSAVVEALGWALVHFVWQGALIALAAAAGLANGLFRPAVYAGLPNLVRDDELAEANSLLQTSENVSWAVAPVVGGALVAAAGPHLGYWVNAATFLGSALLLLGIPAERLQAATAATRGHHDHERARRAGCGRASAVRAGAASTTGSTDASTRWRRSGGGSAAGTP